MKLLFISEFFPSTNNGDFTGGVEAHTFFVAKGLAKRHHVTVIASKTYGVPSSQIISGIHVVRVGPKRKHTAGVDFFRIFFIAGAIWRGVQLELDLVEGTNFSNQIVAYFVGIFKKIPIVAWTPDVWRGQWKKNMGFLGMITGELVERFNLSRKRVWFVAISQTVANKLEMCGIHKKRITVIPCGVDVSLINKIPIKKETRPTIITVSRLIGYKSIDTLIQACLVVVEEIPDVQLKIIGQGPDQKRLELFVKELELTKTIQFLGFIPRYKTVLKKIKSSHLFCLPSKVEGFGIAVVEALACGTPAIVPDTKIMREITGSKGVLFFNLRDYRSLAQKITLLFKDKKRYEKCTREGKKKARIYDWKYSVQKTEELYEYLCTH